MDREKKVIEGLTMLANRTNDDTCEGLKCCKIAEDTLILLEEQKEKFNHLNNITLEYEKEVFRLQALLKEQESKSIVDEVVQGVHEYYLIDDITRTEKIRAHSMLEALEKYKKKNRWDPVIVTKGEKIEERSEYYDE